MKKSELRQIIREELYAELSENEQLDEISLKQGALAALLALSPLTGKAQDTAGNVLQPPQTTSTTSALSPLTGKAQDEVGDILLPTQIESVTTNFQLAFRKSGDEKFIKGMEKVDNVENQSALVQAFAKARKERMKIFKFEDKIYKVDDYRIDDKGDLKKIIWYTDADVATMKGEEVKKLLLAAVEARGVFIKGSEELKQKIDSILRVYPNARFKTISTINYLAPVENKSGFEQAFAKAFKEGMDTFTYEGKEFKVEIDKAGTSKSGKVEIKILPASERVKVDPQNESKLRNIVREVLKGK